MMRSVAALLMCGACIALTPVHNQIPHGRHKQQHRPAFVSPMQLPRRNALQQDTGLQRLMFPHAVCTGAGRKRATHSVRMGMKKAFLDKYLFTVEGQLVAALAHVGQMIRSSIILLLSLLPNLLNISIVVVLLYTAVVSCSPIFNNLLWTPDEGRGPPIRGRKWEDFDKPMRKILRSYKQGDVIPTGSHIDDWNRQVRRRQARLENAVNAAKKYKKALEAERRWPNTATNQAEGGHLFTKWVRAVLARKPSNKALLKAAERAKAEYVQAKADFMQEGTWSASFIRPKKYGTETFQRPAQTALEEADEINQQMELDAMMERLKEMKDEPIEGQLVDTTSQFGTRQKATLLSAEQTYTRLWPKAVAPDGIHMLAKATAKTIGDNDEAIGEVKKSRLRGEKRTSTKPGMETYEVFGSKRTVKKRSRDKKRRFGIPVMWVVIPTCALTAFCYFHVFTSFVAFFAALLWTFLSQDPAPLNLWWSVTGAKILRAVSFSVHYTILTLAFLEAAILTVADCLAACITTALAMMWHYVSIMSEILQQWIIEVGKPILTAAMATVPLLSNPDLTRITQPVKMVTERTASLVQTIQSKPQSWNRHKISRFVARGRELNRKGVHIHTGHSDESDIFFLLS